VQAPDPVFHTPFIGTGRLADKRLMAEAAEPLHQIPLDREHDPREEAEAFQRLPEEAKEEIREVWRRQEGTHEDMRMLRRYSIRGYVIEMACVFVFFELFAMLRHPFVIIPAAIIGAATGWVAAKVRAGQSSYPFIAGVGYILLSCTGAGMNFFAGVAIVSLSTMLGFSHTIRRFDRWES